MVKEKLVEIIYVDGYWNDTKETFKNYKCLLGSEWNCNENDNDIFYYFEDEEGLNFLMKPENCGSEFVITNYRKTGQYKKLIFTK